MIIIAINVIDMNTFDAQAEVSFITFLVSSFFPASSISHFLLPCFCSYFRVKRMWEGRKHKILLHNAHLSEDERVNWEKKESEHLNDCILWRPDHIDINTKWTWNEESESERQKTLFSSIHSFPFFIPLLLTIYHSINILYSWFAASILSLHLFFPIVHR